MRAGDLTLSALLHGLAAGALLLWPQAPAVLPPLICEVTLEQFEPPPPAPPAQVPPAAPEPEPERPPTPPAPVAPVPAPTPRRAAPAPKAVKISPRKTAPSSPAPAPEQTPPSSADADPPALDDAVSPPVAVQPAAASKGTGVPGRQGRSIGGLLAYDAEVVDESPVATHRESPDYPSRARRMRQSGRVLVRVVVDAEGRPQSCAVHESTPSGVFEEAALQAARRFRFKPGRIAGREVVTLVIIPFVFAINE